MGQIVVGAKCTLCFGPFGSLIFVLNSALQEGFRGFGNVWENIARKAVELCGWTVGTPPTDADQQRKDGAAVVEHVKSLLSSQVCHAVPAWHMLPSPVRLPTWAGMATAHTPCLIIRPLYPHWPSPI
mgnify:CR=1 FL=1